MKKLGIIQKTDKRNLITIKAGFHARLHGAVYCNLVGSTVKHAHEASEKNRLKRVEGALRQFKAVLTVISASMPY